MVDVVIYTTNYCPFCVKAKQLLKNKGIEFTEIDLSNDEEGRIKLIEKSGGKKTVPQIFINDKHIGGCDDLYNLNSNGELDKLLA